MALWASAQKMGLGDGVNTTSRAPATTFKTILFRTYLFDRVADVRLAVEESVGEAQ